MIRASGIPKRLSGLRIAVCVPDGAIFRALRGTATEDKRVMSSTVPSSRMNGQPASLPASLPGSMSANLSASQPANTSAGHSPDSASQGDPNRLAQVLLVRIAAGGGRESQIARDLHALVPLQPSGEAWNAQFARLVAALMAAGRATRQGDKLVATAAGQAAAIAFLGCRKPLDQDWNTVRDVLLVAKALGLAGAPQARMKAIDSDIRPAISW